MVSKGEAKNQKQETPDGVSSHERTRPTRLRRFMFRLLYRNHRLVKSKGTRAPGRYTFLGRLCSWYVTSSGLFLPIHSASELNLFLLIVRKNNLDVQDYSINPMICCNLCFPDMDELTTALTGNPLLFGGIPDLPEKPRRPHCCILCISCVLPRVWQR